MTGGEKCVIAGLNYDSCSLYCHNVMSYNHTFSVFQRIGISRPCHAVRLKQVGKMEGEKGKRGKMCLAPPKQKGIIGDPILTISFKVVEKP